MSPGTFDARAERNRLAREASRERTGSAEFDLGFHGDRHLLSLIDAVMPRVEMFIETGANLGNTVLYVARRFPSVRCFSCEPGIAAFEVAARRASAVPNADVRETASPEFFDALATEAPGMLRRLCLFHLDAHGYGFHWPLADEIAWITSRMERAMFLIDDLLVPGRPEFGYDEHEGQVCSIEAMRHAFAPGRSYGVLYPAYSEHTSPFHGLRGHGLVWFGDVEWTLPEAVERRYSRTTLEV